ncbi:MAG: HD domain-containing protein [Desulfobulbaceae bacterium]|nr:HD domain-containing protein [Desulfobulbaceae bacterium]
MDKQPRRQVSELTSAEQIEQIFMVSQPQLRTTSRGDFYIAAFLSDKTGRINGRMWQATEMVFHSLPAEGFVWVRGRTENYQNSLQIVIESIKPVGNEEVDFYDFMPSTKKDISVMWNRLLELLSGIKNPDLAKLVRAFLADSELMKQFRTAPAAIMLHHAYLGGLLEHTVSLLELAERILPHYPQADSDLVKIGLFLHDIGKTTELNYDISFKYSDQGRMIGHLVKGAMLIEDKVRQLNDEGGEPFPRKLADCLEHLIVSHHGTREFGSPVLPATPEAFLVHYMDNLDSKIALTLAEIEKDTTNSDWTNYVKAIEAPVYKMHNFSKEMQSE